MHRYRNFSFKSYPIRQGNVQLIPYLIGLQKERQEWKWNLWLNADIDTQARHTTLRLLRLTWMGLTQEVHVCSHITLNSLYMQNTLQGQRWWMAVYHQPKKKKIKPAENSHWYNKKKIPTLKRKMNYFLNSLYIHTENKDLSSCLKYKQHIPFHYQASRQHLSLWLLQESREAKVSNEHSKLPSSFFSVKSKNKQIQHVYKYKKINKSKDKKKNICANLL